VTRRRAEVGDQRSEAEICETLSAFGLVWHVYPRGAPEYRRPRALFSNAFGVRQRGANFSRRRFGRHTRLGRLYGAIVNLKVLLLLLLILLFVFLLLVVLLPELAPELASRPRRESPSLATPARPPTILLIRLLVGVCLFCPQFPVWAHFRPSQ
jgi:hypothetical protein